MGPIGHLVLEEQWYLVYHSSLPSAEIKNECNYAPFRSVCLHGVGRDNFTFYRYLVLNFVRTSVIGYNFYAHISLGTHTDNIWIFNLDL